MVSTCPSDHFRCPDGRCLPRTAKCDFIRDCVGGYDEEDCSKLIFPRVIRTIFDVQTDNVYKNKTDATRDTTAETEAMKLIVNCTPALTATLIATLDNAFHKNGNSNFRKDCFDGSDENENNCVYK
uniref:Uncharacterized protein n=1 Tax=Strigamia maritima TaxID=126957 RepID=T1JHC5_STRMM